MKKKIYLSGKITGDPNYAVKFKNAEYLLTKAGYMVVNPCLAVPANCASWTEAMRLALRAMLGCEAVALLYDWKESEGAKIEERLAREVGIAVGPIEEWLAEGGEIEAGPEPERKYEKRTGCEIIGCPYWNGYYCCDRDPKYDAICRFNDCWKTQGNEP